jgi:hypothetical protein
LRGSYFSAKLVLQRSAYIREEFRASYFSTELVTSDLHVDFKFRALDFSTKLVIAAICTLT